MLTDQDIYSRYVEKKAEFEKAAPITLIGHSLFDMWQNIEPECSLKGKAVANLGISGVSTRQYLDVIAKEKRITHLGKTVFIFLGVNDIVKEPDYSPAKVLDWILQILTEIRPLVAPQTHYFLLEATPVNQISTVTNVQIIHLNTYLREHCPEMMTFVPPYPAFLDENGNLDATLSIDGLHFNAAGYARLTKILENYL